jgi:hypothetical protein
MNETEPGKERRSRKKVRLSSVPGRNSLIITGKVTEFKVERHNLEQKSGMPEGNGNR